MALFSRHPLLLQTAFSELKRQELVLLERLIGSPGSVGVREVNGRGFYYRQFYDAEGKKAASYLGPVDDRDAIEQSRLVSARIATTNALAKEARLLTQRGYVRVDARTEAVLAALANGGVFRAGGLLVGSHAYGALLNDLGISAAAYTTQDVDIARDEPLSIAPLGVRPSPPPTLVEMLAASTVPLSPIPSLDRRGPSTSYCTPKAADRLRVDLLAPSRDNEIRTVGVPELDAHATAMPRLRYLLAEPLDVVVMGRTTIIPVKAPRPERLAWHKMLLAEQRHETSDKRGKDIEQAAVLTAFLAEDAPQSLEEALHAVPRSARTKTIRGARRTLERLRLAGDRHARATEVLEDLLGAKR